MQHDGERPRRSERPGIRPPTPRADARLVRDCLGVGSCATAGRNLRFGISDRILDALPQIQNVGALGHGNDDTDQLRLPLWEQAMLSGGLVSATL